VRPYASSPPMPLRTFFSSHPHLQPPAPLLLPVPVGARSSGGTGSGSGMGSAVRVAAVAAWAAGARSCRRARACSCRRAGALLHSPSPAVRAATAVGLRQVGLQQLPRGLLLAPAPWMRLPPFLRLARLPHPGDVVVHCSNTR